MRGLASKAATVSLAVSLVACASAGPDQLPAVCNADPGCPGDFVCVFSQCVDPNAQLLDRVQLEVDPGDDSGLPLQSLLNVLLSEEEGRIDVVLQPGLNVRGAVQRDGAAVSGRFLFRPQSFIAGRAIAPGATTDVDGTFSVDLIDGDQYDVTFTPDDVTIPPFYLDGFLARAADLPLELPRGELEITGSVFAGVGAAALPQSGLEVRATSGGRKVSSSVVTGADGLFSLRVPPPLEGNVVEGLTIVVSGPNVPTVEIPDVRVEVLPGAPPQVIDNIDVVDLGDVVGPTRLVLQIVDAGAAPVPFARVFLESEIGNGRFELVADASASGEVSVLVPVGTYRAVAIGPSEASGAGIQTEPVVAELGAEEPQIIRLPARVILNGRVIDSFGLPLPDAQLTVTRVPSPDGLDEFDVSRFFPFAVESDETGGYGVALDPGAYRINVRAPFGSGAPGFSEVVIVGDDGLPHDIVLPSAAFVVGNVLSPAPDLIGVSGAYIRVFSPITDERDAAILLGEGEAGPDGGFEIVVPDLVPGDDEEL